MTDRDREIERERRRHREGRAKFQTELRNRRPVHDPDDPMAGFAPHPRLGGVWVRHGHEHHPVVQLCNNESRKGRR